MFSVVCFLTAFGRETQLLDFCQEDYVVSLMKNAFFTSNYFTLQTLGSYSRQIDYFYESFLQDLIWLLSP